MATETPQTKPAPTSDEKWIAGLKESLGMAVEDNPQATDATAATVSLPSTGATSIAEQAVLMAKLEQAAPAEPSKPADAPASTDAPAATPPAQAAATTPAAPATPATPAQPASPDPEPVKVKRPRVAVVQTPVVPQQAQPAPVEPAKPVEEPAKLSADDQALIDSLTDEERDEYELALYAAQSNPAHVSKPAEVLGFFKKVQQFSAANPDAQPDSQEFQQIIDKNRPRWAPGEKRKLSRKMIEDAAVARAKSEVGAEVTRDLEATKSKLRELEKGPEIAKRVEEFRSNSLVNVPEGYSRIDQDVIQAAAKLSRNELIEQFPVEGAVLVKHFDAVNELEMIKEGVREFAPTNPTHAFLLEFLTQQERYLETAPEAIKRDAAGRTFVSRMRMDELLKRDPNAMQKHWFIDNEMLKSQLAIHAHEEVGNRVDQFKKAGFERRQPAKTATQPVVQPAQAQPAAQPKPQAQPASTDNPHAGPKASVSTAPGVETVVSKPTPAQEFIRSRIPGYKFSK